MRFALIHANAACYVPENGSAKVEKSGWQKDPDVITREPDGWIVEIFYATAKGDH